MLEGNVGVGLMEDKGVGVGQENTIPDGEGEDSAEDNSEDMYWVCRFEADVIRKKVSDWLAGQRREQEDNRAGQVDVLELTGSRLMELMRQGWEEKMDQWAQRMGDLRVPRLEKMVGNLTRQARNLEAPRLEHMILFTGIVVTILGALVFAGLFGCCCWVTVGCMKAIGAGADTGVRAQGADLAEKGSNMTRSEANLGVVEEYGDALEEVNNDAGDEVDGGVEGEEEGGHPPGRMTLRDWKQEK